MYVRAMIWFYMKIRTSLMSEYLITPALGLLRHFGQGMGALNLGTTSGFFLIGEATKFCWSEGYYETLRD